MESIYLWPQREVLDRTSQAAAEWMFPNTSPWVVTFPAILTGAQCDAIINEMMREEPYSFPHCDAETRECPQKSVLWPIERAALSANDWFFNYDLGTRSQSWLQTYHEGQSYAKHMDGAPGENRKLSAVALLSDDGDYRGGDLQFDVPPNVFSPHQQRGTIVVFPFWVQHKVLPITKGVRQTINMGFWGPPFK